jgi:prophage tail gpP-like protein
VSDELVLRINGNTYAKWSEARVTRALKECASSFDLAVSERWKDGEQPDQPLPWVIKPQDQAVVSIGSDTLLTGYVDYYYPYYDAHGHSVRIGGRSKTCDLVDCMPDVTPDEYDGYKLDAIAKAIAAPFGVDVVVECDVGDAFPDVTHEKTETAFQLLEKLARLRAVILTDNEMGQLVLTQAGKGGSAGSIVEGGNILAAGAKLAANERFSDYVVLSQTPLAFDEEEAETQIVAQAKDAGVTRFRRYAEIAENPLDTDQAQKRADWRARHQAAISSEGNPVLQGFRQADAALWKINRTVYMKAPRLGLDQQLLIGRVSHMVDDAGGSRTDLLVAPPAAFTPEPDPKSANNSDAIWKDAVKITP